MRPKNRVHPAVWIAANGLSLLWAAAWATFWLRVDEWLMRDDGFVILYFVAVMIWGVMLLIANLGVALLAALSKRFTPLLLAPIVILVAAFIGVARIPTTLGEAHGVPAYSGTTAMASISTR